MQTSKPATPGKARPFLGTHKKRKNPIKADKPYTGKAGTKQDEENRNFHKIVETPAPSGRSRRQGAKTQSKYKT